MVQSVVGVGAGVTLGVTLSLLRWARCLHAANRTANWIAAARKACRIARRLWCAVKG